MSALTAKLFTDYFSGTWRSKVFMNGVFVHEIGLSYYEDHNIHDSLTKRAVSKIFHSEGKPEDTLQVGFGAWRNDIRRWCEFWHDRSGAYNELQWTSQQVVNGITVLYGFVHECKEEGNDPAEYIAMCELKDSQNFKFTSQSYRRGILEVEASRIGTSKAS